MQSLIDSKRGLIGKIASNCGQQGPLDRADFVTAVQRLMLAAASHLDLATLPQTLRQLASAFDKHPIARDVFQEALRTAFSYDPLRHARAVEVAATDATTYALDAHAARDGLRSHLGGRYNSHYTYRAPR